MNRLHLLAALLVASLLSIPANSARAQFQDLVKHLPSGANTLVLFNVEKIHDSPLGVKEKWRERHENAFSSGLIIVPPQSNRFAMAAHVDFETNRPSWDAAVMDLAYEPSMPKVAAYHGGTVDEIEGVHTAVLPSDTYVVQFGKRLAGVMSPGNRQRVAGWIDEVYSNTRKHSLSGYLKEAESYADRGAPVIMAIDLRHVLSAKDIRRRLDTFQALEGHSVDLDKLSEVLASVQGVTLGITITDKVFGKIKVDFGQDVSMMKDFAKPALLEALGNHGAMIDEFKEWTPKVSGSHVTLEGFLYQSGRQRILSLVDAPPGLQPPPNQAAGGAEQDQQKLVALASQQYFKTIKRFMDDLREKRGSTRFVTTSQVGTWYDRYARKIDALPILNVDRQLVEFGGWVANQMRQATNAMKGISTQTSLRVSEKPNAQVYNYQYAAGGGVARGRYGGVGGYGGYAYRYREDPRASMRLESQQRAQIQTQERIRGYTSANTTMQGLDAEMAEIRRQMTDKYGVEF